MTLSAIHPLLWYQLQRKNKGRWWLTKYSYQCSDYLHVIIASPLSIVKLDGPALFGTCFGWWIFWCPVWCFLILAPRLLSPLDPPCLQGGGSLWLSYLGGGGYRIIWEPNRVAGDFAPYTSLHIDEAKSWLDAFDYAFQKIRQLISDVLFEGLPLLSFHFLICISEKPARDNTFAPPAHSEWVSVQSIMMPQ